MLLALVVVLCASACETLSDDLVPAPSDDETIGMADAIHQSVLACNTNYFIFY